MVSILLFFYPTNENRKEITILYCGRLDEGKGLADLLQLAKDIENKGNIDFVSLVIIRTI